MLKPDSGYFFIGSMGVGKAGRQNENKLGVPSWFEFCTWMMAMVCSVLKIHKVVFMKCTLLFM